MTTTGKRLWNSLVGTDGRTILCITTLSHRRFIDDVVQVLGLPAGSRLLLRYRKRYVSQNLWAAAKDGRIVDWHALIVLGGTDTDGSDRYEPLRVGTVSSLMIAGEILTLEVAMGGYAADGDHVWPEIASIAANLPVALGDEGAKKGLYAQDLPRCPGNVVVDESVEGWERAADAFFRLDAARHVPFLFMMQGGADATFLRHRESGELVVESGSTLPWNIHTKCAPRPEGIMSPLGEVLIEVSCPPMRMITSRRIRIDSRRDVRQMRLACDAVFRTVRGHLSVKLITFQFPSGTDGTASDRNPVTLSRHDIPVRAGRVLPTLASLAAAGATVAAMLDKTGWPAWQDQLVAAGAGLLVFLSLKYGFRGGGS
jgi:hypothetical protein